MESHNIKKLTVTKHHHLTKASYRLDVDERRLLFSALSLVNPQVSIDGDIEVSADLFAEQWGIDKKNVYHQLKKARDNLYERTVRLQKLDSNTIWDIRWIDGCSYNDVTRCVKLSFGKKITPYLSDLKKWFSSYKLTDIKALKSGHSMRLYDLLMQFEDNGFYTVFIRELREQFGVIGKHKRWVDLRRYVIDVAVKEINSQTPYKVHYELEKKGRAFHKITFFFELRSQLDMFQNL